MKKNEKVMFVYDDLYLNNHLFDEVASKTEEEKIRSIWFHTIVYKDEIKCVPDYVAEAPISKLDLEVDGDIRWHFYEERIFSLADVHCRLEDLMVQNEDITEEALEFFWNSIPATAGNYTSVSFEGRTVILAASLKNKPITPAYFPSATHVVSALQESGATNFGQLPAIYPFLPGRMESTIRSLRCSLTI